MKNFALALCLALFAVSAATARQLAITFDDAPRNDGQVYSGPERTAALIDALKRAGVPSAMFFANSQRVDEAGKMRLAAYVEAGHTIANHSHSHPSVNRVGAEAFLADVKLAHDRLSKLPGYAPYFRFPFLHEGRPASVRDEVREGLKLLGLKQGYVTIDNYDWHLESLMSEAIRSTGSLNLDGWRQLYLDMLLTAINFYDKQAITHLGRSPRHVLLLHENDLAALFIDDLVHALRVDGWEIINAEAAYEDPIAAALPDTLFLGQGRIAALAHQGGANARSLIHPWESEAALRAEAVRRGLLAVPAQAYLGQTQPGLIPQKFAPGQISLDGRYEYGSVFSADGLQFYFGVALDGRAQIYQASVGEAGEIAVALLLHDETHTYGDPMLSPDESRLYFITNQNGAQTANMDIGFIRRTRDGWSEPALLPAPINTPANEYYMSFTRTGTMAFSTDRALDEEGNVDLLFAEGVEGPGPLVLSTWAEHLNTPAYEADPFIAPDGSYLIFASNRRTGRDRDLYVSFKLDDDSWSEAIAFDASINTPYQELCPFVSADGRFLFFTHKQDLYWVSADIIALTRERHLPR